MLHSLTTQNAREVLHLAFRASYLKTFDSLVASFDMSPQPRDGAGHGFLSHIPLIAGCALQVQLDQLLQTWQILASGGGAEISDVDHCVCYCVASHLAHLGETDDQRSVQRAAEGLDGGQQIDYLWLASKLRTMQITWPFSAESGVIVRDHYLCELSMDLPASKAIERCSQRDALLELVGRWTVTPEIVSNANGLLTQHETLNLGAFFMNNPQLMNL